MHENAVPPQQHSEYHLCVPGSGPTSLLATVPPEEAADQEIQVDATSGELQSGTQADDTAFADSPRPMRVFSPSLFVAQVCREPFCN